MAQHALDPPAQQLDQGARKARRKAGARRKAENGKRHSEVPRRSFTIDEWCAAHSLSRSFYEQLKRKGRGPRELRDGKIIRITLQADAEWSAAREGTAVSD